MNYKKHIKYLWNYRLLVGALTSLIIGIILFLTHHIIISDWLLGIVAALECFPLVKSMWHDLRGGAYGIDILALTAIITAIILRQEFAAIIIVIMLSGGSYLEEFAEKRAHSELNALLTKTPSIAHIIRGRKIIDINAKEVRVGDKLVIKPGELVPVDATIIEGTSSFNESSLTGESMPVMRQIGGEIISGSINNDSPVTVKALHIAKNSQYEQIIKLVRSASSSHSPFVRLADRYSIPFTIAAYVIGGAVWIISGHAIRFLEVIVVATPCPLLLAAPIALISGMSRSSKYGVIVKSGSALEKLAETKTFVFDKTGTLTTGDLTIARIISINPYTKDEVLAIAASLEQNSNHIIAKSIIKASEEKHIKLKKVKNVIETSGQGLKAMFKGDSLILGREDFLRKNKVEIPSKYLDTQSNTSVYIAIDNKLAGIIYLNDSLRPESKKTIKRIMALGINRIVMITGDNKLTADNIAKQLGLKTVYAETLPGEKLHALEDIRQRPITFVGDGVNDAPVLTGADVGIALGAKGSTAASESADLVILPDDLGHVAIAVEIAKKTFAIAKQSILIGIGLSFILMLLFATGKFMPVYGAIIQEAVDVLVIFNALRAHTIKVKS